MVTVAPFTLVSVFATKPSDGNPAAVVFMPDLDVEFSYLQGLATNFNQPMASFVKVPTPPTDGSKTVRTDIRYMTSTAEEAAICGHATIASAKAILLLPEFANADIKEFQFQTRKRGIVSVNIVEEGLFELVLPSTTPEPLPKEEVERLTPIIRRGFKRDVDIVDIRFGGEKYPYILMVEIHEDEGLGDADVDKTALGDTGYIINSFSTAASKSVSSVGEEYVCRMFSRVLPGGEDPVCGTMQCVLAPYWYGKKGIPSGKQIVSKQVSPRGGVVKIVWDDAAQVIRLRGDCHVVAQGTCCY